MPRGGLCSWLLLGVVLAFGVVASPAQASKAHHYDFFIKEKNVTRLCHEKTVLTVNGEFPGPTIYARKGDVAVVNVYNQGHKNITLHWHGVDQPRNPWFDGPEYITQCPIQPGANFTYRVIFSEEEGTVWWHAHSDYDRATVYGAIIIHPKRGSTYPYPKPHKEIPIILGEWWKADVEQVLKQALQTGSDFNYSDASTINGQPGDLFPCSKNGTIRAVVEHGKRYLLRIIHAGLTYEMFFAVAGHNLTVVGMDGSYLRPFTVESIMISPGQTFDVLLDATHGGGSANTSRYYMAARAFSTILNATVKFDDTTATAILEYKDAPPSSAAPVFPTNLPALRDVEGATAYLKKLRSLVTKDHPVDVPTHVDEHMFVAVAVNSLPCGANKTCQGPDGQRLAASLNNASFEYPSVDVLDAYHSSMNNLNSSMYYKPDFPDKPPVIFNFTDSSLLNPTTSFTKRGTRVKVLEYGTVVEVVFQETGFLGPEDHPIHLHGHSFYVVGRGSGNFDLKKDPATYNLVDPPYQNTVSVPRYGWVTIRFRAANPGVWFMHCHVERHTVWGMETVFIVKNGKTPDAQMMPRPPTMPKC